MEAATRIPEPEVAALPEPVVEPELEPVLAFEVAPEPEPEPYIEPARPEPAPFIAPTKVFEPLRAAAYAAPAAPAEAMRASAEPAIFQPTARPEPAMVESRPVARIVDPSVADEDDSEQLFPTGTSFADDRRQRGGWLSIFQRPRHDTPHPTLRQTGSAQPAIDPQIEEPSEDGEDLEIPSFLRRLAN
jgi:cell division protein FtsZ